MNLHWTKIEELLYMGKKKNRQIQQAAHQRGYRAAMEDLKRDAEKVSSAVYNIRLLIETSSSITLDNVASRLEYVQEKANDLVDKTKTSRTIERRPSILDLQNSLNIYTGIDVDPMEVVDDRVVDFLIEQEFEDR